MKTTTKVFIGMLIIVLGVLIWAIYFTDDLGVIEEDYISLKDIVDAPNSIYIEKNMKGKM